MAFNIAAALAVVFALCLLRAEAQTPGQNGVPFDWGRPCTLVGGTAEVQITGPGNAACTNCGSGATAVPQPTCTFKPLTFPVGSAISIFYHSSVHHLYLGSKACDFSTKIEVCANGTATEVSKETPCKYTFTTPGSYYISDITGKGNAEDGEYCKDFGASLPVTVSAST